MKDINDNYAHCIACDKVINIDKDKYATDGINTFCENCKCDCLDCVGEE